MSQQKPPSFQEQAQQRQQDEALRVAKATQAPGQTREQTKLIAKGIEKGIALYKQQQRQKSREQDKARKKALRLRTQAPIGASSDDAAPEESAYQVASAKPALMVAGGFFSIGALAHIGRYFLKLDMILGAYPIPISWSLPAAVIAAGLALWMFRTARHAI